MAPLRKLSASCPKHSGPPPSKEGRNLSATAMEGGPPRDPPKRRGVAHPFLRLCRKGGAASRKPLSLTQALDPTGLNRPPSGMRSWSDH